MCKKAAPLKSQRHRYLCNLCNLCNAICATQSLRYPRYPRYLRCPRCPRYPRSPRYLVTTNTQRQRMPRAKINIAPELPHSRGGPLGRGILWHWFRLTWQSAGHRICERILCFRRRVPRAKGDRVREAAIPQGDGEVRQSPHPTEQDGQRSQDLAPKHQKGPF